MKESADKSILIAQLRREVQEHLSTISECQSKIRENETVRRKLHNSIQELKGKSKNINFSIMTCNMCVECILCSLQNLFWKRRPRFPRVYKPFL